MAGLNPRITVEPGKMGGKPCIRGLRFTVYDLASYLASGMTEEEILTDFPYLEKEDSRRFTNSSPASRKGSRFLKLLVDENLAPRLANDLADLFPGSTNVSFVDLGSSPDAHISALRPKSHWFRHVTAQPRKSSASSVTTPRAFWNSSDFSRALLVLR